MVKYVGMVLQMAKLAGEVKEMEMREANKYFPAKIAIAGTTNDGQDFDLVLSVGERKNADS